MCYTKPGPRCSNHAGKAVASKKKKLQSAKRNLIASKRAHQNDPEDAEKKTVYAKHAREFVTAREEFNRAQRDYDGTPKGRKELEAAIEKETSKRKRGEYQQRLLQGKMLYNWRKNQLDLKRLEKETGKTLKQRRGKFLTNPGQLVA